MLYFDKESFLLSTGLGMSKISEIISRSKSEEEIEQRLKEAGDKYLNRYRTMKKYKELVYKGEVKEPIIPIIAALPCVGKTTLAREVATAFRIGNVMGGDAIRASYRELVDKEKNPEFFVSIYGAWQFVGDKTETKENIIEGFYKQAKMMNMLMERIVLDRGIRDGESMVIEYLHFLPSQYDSSVLNHPSVIPIILRLESMDEWKKRVGDRDRVTHLKGNSQRLIPALDKYKMMQEVQCEDAKKTNVHVISTDNLEEAKEKIFDIIFERIEKLIEIKEVSYDDIESIKKIKDERKENPDEKVSK